MLCICIERSGNTFEYGNVPACAVIVRDSNFIKTSLFINHRPLMTFIITAERGSDIEHVSEFRSEAFMLLVLF